MKKKVLAALFLGAAVALCGAGLTACGGNTPCKHKNAVRENAKAAECTAAGNDEYWYCGDCGKYFSDAALTVETTLAAVTIPKKGHGYGELVAEVSAGCTTAGTIAYYHCNACGTYFDENKNVVTDLVIPAKQHKYVYAYNYADARYVGTCQNNASHDKDYKAAGTAEFPYLANDEASFNAAVAAGGYVKLASDVNFANPGVNNISNKLSVDLDGHKLSGKIYFGVQNGGDLSVSNGKVEVTWFKNPANNKNVLQFIDLYGGKARLDLIDYKSAAGCIAIFATGEFDISNSKIKAGVYGYALSTNANDGTITPTVNINNSTMLGYVNAVLFNVGGELNAADSHFYAVNQALIVRAGKAVLTECRLENNVSDVDANGNIIPCVTEVSANVDVFNGYYDKNWSSGNTGVPINPLVVGNKNGNYVNVATCELYNCAVIDGMIGVSGGEKEFIHYSVYAITDGTDGATASVKYDKATADKSGFTPEKLRADAAATIEPMQDKSVEAE